MRIIAKKKKNKTGPLKSASVPDSSKAGINLEEISKRYDDGEVMSVEFPCDRKIELSVLIPMFRAEKVGWIALEALCRQEEIDFAWELIIIEENFESPLGWDALSAYLERLKKIGCTRIFYKSIKKWIPLGAKWFYLISESSPSSIIGAMSSADMYAGPSRLKRQYDALKGSGKNWYKVRGNITYDIRRGRHIKVVVPPERTDSCLQAVSMELLRRLPLDSVKANVDGWRYRTLSAGRVNAFVEQTDELMLTTVNTHGLNNISGENRATTWLRHKECCESISNHVPEDIARRLTEAKNDTLEHSRLREASDLEFKGKKAFSPNQVAAVIRGDDRLRRALEEVEAKPKEKDEKNVTRKASKKAAQNAGIASRNKRVNRKRASNSRRVRVKKR